MEEATPATIFPNTRSSRSPPAVRSAPSPAVRGAPMATPAPSSAPTALPAPTAAPRGPAAAPREPMAPPAAPSAPSTTAAPAATSVPSAPPPPATAGHLQSGGARKRKLENSELQNSTYFKIRAIVRDLRPAFIEVLRAPDFRNCKAAYDIQRQIKMLLELSKQLRIEQAGQPQLDKPPNVLETDRERTSKPDIAPASIANRAGKDTSIPEEIISEARGLEKQLQGYQGTYIVGGSPMGWNFLVYRGSEPVYYGVTKEAFRSLSSDTLAE
uniref:Uncharacterized protein n=1 Tax=Anthurium amnicola TaxID=1678845 RepID=A0A1D1YXZ7_9ARAE